MLCFKRNLCRKVRKKDWKEFYEISYGGFETLSSEEDDNIENSSDDDYSLSEQEINDISSEVSISDEDTNDETLETTDDLTDISSELSENEVVSDDY